MPRNVRNWWIEVQVDGRKGRIACGPVSKSGGFSLTIKQRDKGAIRTVIDCVGDAEDGRLSLSLTSGSDVLGVDTER